jgi:hypothetical protein
MLIKCLFDAVKRREDIGRRVTAFVLPISNRPRVTSSCAGKLRLREPGEHASGPNLASRDDVAHNQNLYTILGTPPPVITLCRKQVRTHVSRRSRLVGVPRTGVRGREPLAAMHDRHSPDDFPILSTFMSAKSARRHSGDKMP